MSRFSRSALDEHDSQARLDAVIRELRALLAELRAMQVAETSLTVLEAQIARLISLTL